MFSTVERGVILHVHWVGGSTLLFPMICSRELSCTHKIDARFDIFFVDLYVLLV